MKNRLMQLSVLLLSLTLTACMGDRKMAALLDNVPAGVDFVAVGNVKTVLESAGGSLDGTKITLPKYLRDELTASDLEQTNEVLKFIDKSGVDPTACAVSASFGVDYPTFVFSIDDEDQFVSTLKNEEFEKESTVDDLTVYVKTDGNPKAYHHKTFVGVKGSCAFLVPEVSSYSDFDGERHIKRFVSKAEEEPFGATAFADYITKGSTMGCAVRMSSAMRKQLDSEGFPASYTEMLSGVVCCKGELDGSKLTMKGKIFTLDGEEKDLTLDNKFLDYDAKINTKALSYMTKDENFVFAASLKKIDWDALVDTLEKEAVSLSASEKAMLVAMKGYLARIDGTVAIGMGVKGGLDAFVQGPSAEALNAVSLTMVVETKEGKAKSVVTDIQGLLDAAGGSYTITSKGLSIEVPGGGAGINVEAADNFLVIANHDISNAGGCPVVEHLDFGDYLYATAFSVSPGNKLLKDLGVKNGFVAASTSDLKKAESTVTLELTGAGEEGFLSGVIKAIVSAGKKAEALSRSAAQPAFEPEPDYMGE